MGPHENFPQIQVMVTVPSNDRNIRTKKSEKIAQKSLEETNMPSTPVRKISGPTSDLASSPDSWTSSVIDESIPQKLLPNDVGAATKTFVTPIRRKSIGKKHCDKSPICRLAEEEKTDKETKQATPENMPKTPLLKPMALRKPCSTSKLMAKTR